jgi:hypothetical protein
MEVACTLRLHLAWPQASVFVLLLSDLTPYFTDFEVVNISMNGSSNNVDPADLFFVDQFVVKAARIKISGFIREFALRFIFVCEVACVICSFFHFIPLCSTKSGYVYFFSCASAFLLG